MIMFKHSRAVGENTVGPATYRKDFERVVQPHLEKVETDRNIIFSTLTETPSWLADDKDADRIVQVLHSMDFMYNLQDLEDFTAGGRETVFITHYMALANKINEQTPHAAYYIPMSVDTKILPTPSKKYEKVIYYGNLYDEKLPMHSKIVASILEDTDCLCDFNTLSFGYLNFGDEKKSHMECLRSVAKYSIGIGVGRCALEMLAMGCKVIVAGDNYGGLIDCEPAFDHHHHWNFNSKGDSKQPFPDDFADVLQRARECNFEPDLSKIDMRNYISEYKNTLLWTHQTIKQTKFVQKIARS